MFVTLNISTKITVLRREKSGAFKHSSIFNNSVAETFLPHLLFNVSNVIPQGLYRKRPVPQNGLREFLFN